MAAGDISDALVSSFRLRIGDPGSLLFTDAQCFAALNLAYLQLAKELADPPLYALFAVQTTALGAGIVAYALPTDLLRERLVEYKGIPARRWPLDQSGLVESSSLAAATEADPAYFIWGGNVNLLNACTGGGNLVVSYLKRPTTITTNVDPEMGREFDEMVEMYAQQTLRQSSPITQAHARAIVARLQTLTGIINQRYQGGASFDDDPRDPRRLADVSRSQGTR